MSRASPSTLRTERLVLPAASEKMRRFAILVAKPIGFGLPVVVARAQEDDQPLADLAYGLSTDRNLPLSNALDHCLHAPHPPRTRTMALAILAAGRGKVKPEHRLFLFFRVQNANLADNGSIAVGGYQGASGQGGTIQGPVRPQANRASCYTWLRTLPIPAGLSPLGQKVACAARWRSPSLRSGS